ncbi:Internalin-A_precursor [Hexamita inflata]|uniref:Internalin-A n=1 Tax=Hexamita inflata TaxID=28002 RepID=A0AA86Q1E5_9EUKA|nr:Internalin-A precursor [Hexamita inflata]
MINEAISNKYDSEMVEKYKNNLNNMSLIIIKDQNVTSLKFTDLIPVNMRLTLLDCENINFNDVPTQLMELVIHYEKSHNLNIEGLAQMKGLKLLHLPNCQIADEHIKELQNINYLFVMNMSNNQIKLAEQFTAFKRLRVLTLNNNQIESTKPLKSISLLEQLNLSSNQLQNINGLENLSRLKALYLSDNNIQSVDELKGLINLKMLYLDRNKLDNVQSLKNLINLTILYLENNNLKSVEPLKALIQLTYRTFIKLKLNRKYQWFGRSHKSFPSRNSWEQDRKYIWF